MSWKSRTIGGVEIIGIKGEHYKVELPQDVQLFFCRFFAYLCWLSQVTQENTQKEFSPNVLAFFLENSKKLSFWIFSKNAQNVV